MCLRKDFFVMIKSCISLNLRNQKTFVIFQCFLWFYSIVNVNMWRSQQCCYSKTLECEIQIMIEWVL